MGIIVLKLYNIHVENIQINKIMLIILLYIIFSFIIKSGSSQKLGSRLEKEPDDGKAQSSDNQCLNKWVNFLWYFSSIWTISLKSVRNALTVFYLFLPFVKIFGLLLYNIVVYMCLLVRSLRYLFTNRLFYRYYFIWFIIVEFYYCCWNYLMLLGPKFSL